MTKDMLQVWNDRLGEIFLVDAGLKSFGIQKDSAVINGFSIYLSLGYESTPEGKSFFVESEVKLETYYVVQDFLIYYLTHLTHFPQKEYLFKREDFI